MLALFVLLVLLLIFSGLFSAAETAYTSLTFLQIEEMAKTKAKQGRMVRKLAQNRENLLITILIGNNLANIGATVLATYLTTNLLGSQTLGIMTGVLTFIILIFGEVTPKRLAILYNEYVSLHIAYPLYVLSFLFKPFFWAVKLSSSLITKLFSGKIHSPISLRSIFQMITMAENIGVVQDYESKMVKSIFRLNDISTKAIMTHRTDVFSLNMEERLNRSLNRILSSGYSRIPIYDRNPEKIVGIVLLKDILQHLSQNTSDVRLKEIMLKPIFISEKKRVDQVFSIFKKVGLNMAIVMDEYGGLSGIITMEDIIEEILGEIYDEKEQKENEKIIALGNQGFSIKGDTSLHQINDILETKLPEGKYMKTLGGYLTKQLGRIPKKQDTIRVESGKFIIEKIHKNRVKVVRYVPFTEKESQPLF